MNKTLKFPHHYVEHILSNNTGITTRIFDDKNFIEGDIVDFIDKETNISFATAKIYKITEITFKEGMYMFNDLNDESYKTMREMYTEYHNGKTVTDNEIMKVLYYELIT